MPEVVYLQTTNPQKLEEYQTILGRHRLTVVQVSPETQAEELLRQTTHGKVVAVMREESNLHDYDTSKKIDTHDLEDLRVVNNITRLRCHFSSATTGTIQQCDYEAAIEGFIRPANEIIPEEGDPRFPVFGWDKRFVSKGTGLSYHDMRRRGVKLSGRDRVLAAFTREHLTFEARRDFKTFPLHAERTIDFKIRPIDFFSQNKFVTNNQNVSRYGVKNLLHTALNQGIFFRAANNRRENIYWNPGGNGGIPATPKIDKTTGTPDPFHETTYVVFHDGAHHVLCPDLIPDGSKGPLSKKIQTLRRMMSEALTLVAADMLFVDTVKDTGYQYDYGKRKIHPLFESLKRSKDFTDDPAALKQLYYANVRYALRGDDSVYKQMGADEEALATYEGKYKAYFVEDYRWTEQNIKNMNEDAEKFKAWRKSVEPLSKLKKYTTGSMTVSECVAEIGNFVNKPLDSCTTDELIDALFEMTWVTTIEPSLQAEEVQVDDDHALKSGFLKYMMAQMYIFDVFDFIPESANYGKLITDYLLIHIDTLTQHDIDIVRNLYSQYVRILFDRGAITEEDRNMYPEVFPFFPPCYVNYDKDKDSYPELADVSRSILDAV